MAWASASVYANPTPTIKLTSQNKIVESVAMAPATASAAFRLANAGKIRFQTQSGGSWDEQWPYDEWLEPESSTEAANYEVWAEPVSGTITGGTVRQWLAMSNPNDWTIARTSAGTSQAVINLRIRRIGTTTVLASTDVTLRATVNNPPTIKLSSQNKLVESVVDAPETASASFRLASGGKIRFQTRAGGSWDEQWPYD